MKARRQSLAGIVAIGLGACTTPLSVAEVRELCNRIPAPAKLARHEAAVRIQSPQLSGEFHAVLITRNAPFGVRLQLFPEVGGKVLDVLTTVESQKGVLPMTGATYDSDAPRQSSILQMFASSVGLAQSHIKLSDVARAWRDQDGTAWLRLTPRFGVADCLVSIDGQGQRIYRLRAHAPWRMTLLDEAVHIDAPDFQLHGKLESREAIRSAPDGTFQLQIPDGPRR